MFYTDRQTAEIDSTCEQEDAIPKWQIASRLAMVGHVTRPQHPHTRPQTPCYVFINMMNFMFQSKQGVLLFMRFYKDKHNRSQ